MSIALCVHARVGVYMYVWRCRCVYGCMRELECVQASGIAVLLACPEVVSNRVHRGDAKLAVREEEKKKKNNNNKS